MEYVRRRCHGGENQTDCQQQDRAQIRAEITPGSEHCSRVQQRGQKKIEHQIRLKVNRGNFGDQRQNQSANRQQDGIGNFDLTRR